jgi:hypothetical protein
MRCIVLATLNRTLATGSLARIISVGNIILCVTSWPQGSAKTYENIK